MSKLLEVGIILRAFDKATAPIQKLTEQVNRLKQSQNIAALSASTKKFSNDLGLATQEASRLGLKLAAIGGISGWAFKSQFVDTAAEFERFRTILETVEGSAEKAKSSLRWVSDFATKTPYELSQVMEGFVKLKSYGLEPTNGLLKTLGDTSSAMGKPLMQAVEAIADAVTGENERLKEFGIKARVQGEKITYEYSHMGKTMTAEADRSNRQMIETVLTGIFNSKYHNAMLKQSRTWTGMMSNIMDQWTRFKILVMQAGVFDFLKNKLAGILESVDKLAESGKLAQIAKSASVEIIQILKDLWEITKAVTAGIKIFAGVISTTADMLGGYHYLIKLITLFMSAKFILAVAKTGKSFVDIYKSVAALQKSYAIQNLLNAIKYKGGFLNALNYALMTTKLRMLEALTATRAFAAAQLTNLKTGLFSAIANTRILAATYMTALIPAITSASAVVWGFTTALLANPITWVVGLVALLAGSAYLVIKYWEPIKEFFNTLWQGIIKIFTLAVERIKKNIEIIKQIYSPIFKLFNKFKNFGANTKIESVQKTLTTQNLPKVSTLKPQNISRQSSQNNSISYAPNITINGASQSAKEDFAKLLKEHSSEVERIMKNADERKMRLAY